MVKKVKKYLDFDYLSLIWQLMLKGRYIHTTYTNTDKKKALITTNFYIDGDALTVIYENNDEVLVEDHPEKLKAHNDFLKKKLHNMEIFETHVKWFTTVFSALVSLLAGIPDAITQLGVTGAFTLAGYFFSRYFFKAVVWLVRFFFRMKINRKSILVEST